MLSRLIDYKEEMKTKIKNLLNGKIVTVEKTTNHPMSSYNQEVWVDKDGNCYGQCNLGVPVGYELILERNILVTFSDRQEIFSSLAPFFRKYPEYKKYKSNIETHLSRKGIPYEAEGIKIERKEVTR